MRVLGVDPGLTRCGIGVVDVDARRTATMVHVCVVGTAAEVPLDQRIARIDQELDVLLDTYAPDVVAIERVFSQQNVSTVMGTAQVTGVVIAAAARRNIAVALHTPTEVKAAVTGNGQADKAAVTSMVTRILKLDKAPSPADAADALALAITHAWRQGTQGVNVSGSAESVSTDGEGATKRTGAQQAWAQAAADAKAREKSMLAKTRKAR